jgi:hypothetical protein
MQGRPDACKRRRRINPTIGRLSTTTGTIGEKPALSSCFSAAFRLRTALRHFIAVQ